MRPSGAVGASRAAREPKPSCARIPTETGARQLPPPDFRRSRGGRRLSLRAFAKDKPGWYLTNGRKDMKGERFDLIAEPAPRMSEATRADIEALRASDRLQSIFVSDAGSRSANASVRPRLGAPERREEAAESGLRGLLSRRRARVIGGLVLVYVGLAFLAIEGFAALGEGPEPTPLVAAPGAPDGVEAGTPAVPGRPPSSEEATASSDGTQDAKRTVQADRAVGNAEDETPAADRRFGVAETADAVPVAPAVQQRVVSSEAAAAVDGAEAEGVGRKTSNDLAKSIGLAAAVRRSVAAGRTERPAGDGRGEREHVLVELGAAEPGEVERTGIGSAVPQATWSPSPVPAPRMARLSDAPAGGGPDQVGAAASPSQGTAPAGRLEAPQRSASAPPRIVLHYRTEAGESAARSLARTLRARGLVRTELRRVPVDVSQANVRYFHDQNRLVARQVNGLLLSMGRHSDLRDFTHYAPLPSVGTVEVWFPG